MANHIAEAVAPLEFTGQVRLARHEVIARLCYALKGDHNLSICLYGQHTSHAVHISH